MTFAMSLENPLSPLPEPDLAGFDAAKLMEDAISETPDAEPPIAGWTPPLPEELEPLMPGYKITAVLGRGGMGAVYRGIQESLEREVAIKLLPPELGQDPEFAARFRREAKSMAKLNHPNIVQIHDFGQTTEGHLFFAMEFVDGTDLNQLMKTGGLDQIGALNAVSQICDALEYAHSQGFVHRDIKPANIFIDSRGNLKVGDFGLAKLVGEEVVSETEQMGGLTMTGTAMGTPLYMAPEQMDDGANVDHRADIYSLGVMFYEMLTGDIPRGAVRPPSKVKALDVRIDGVVFKAMEQEPDARYQSATDLRTDVDEVRTSGSDQTPAEPSKLAVLPLVAICAVVALLVGSVAWLMNGGSQAPGGPFGQEPGAGAAAQVTGDAEDVAADPIAKRLTHPTLPKLPLPIPELPPLPVEKCRLVAFFLEKAEADSNHRKLKPIQNDDYDDLVKFGRFGGPQAVAIRSNGEAVWWRTSGKIVSPPGAVVAIRNRDGAELFTLNKRGEAWVAGDGADSFPGLKTAQEIAELAAYDGLAVAIHRDGSVSLYGKNAKSLNPRKVLEVEDPRRLAWVSERFLLVIRSGGQIAKIENAQISETFAEKAVESYNPFGPPQLFRNPAGEFFSNEPSYEHQVRFFNQVSDPIFAVLSYPWAMAAKTKFGWQIKFRQRTQGERWRSDPKVESLVADAVDLRIVQDLNHLLVLALLPADTVPRSGLWDVDELIAARANWSSSPVQK